MRKVDVLVIGAGTAGLTALKEVKKKTQNYLLVNSGPYGTTCARVGCMPSKVLIEAANAYHSRLKLDEFGISGATSLEVQGQAVMQRVRRLRDGFVEGTLKATNELGDKNISGHAQFLGPQRVQIEDEIFEAKAIIIATGSAPACPPAWKKLGPAVLTSDEIFELEEIPRSLAVIGTGAIGIELAQAFSRLGVKTDIFSQDHRLAGLTDPRITESFHKMISKELSLHQGAPVEIEPAANNLLRVKSRDADVTVEKVLVAIGRRPSVKSLGLENLGLPLDERGLPPIDPETLQIADLPIFIAGDVSGHRPLLHEAADEGYIAGQNALREDLRRCQRRVPLAIVFSDPQVAVVGRKFEELNENEIHIGESDFAKQGRARAAQKNQGLLRIYASRQTAQILGAEMAIPAAEHLSHFLALAMTQKMTVHALLRTPFYHPVLEEGLRTALRALSKQLPGGAQPDLAGCAALGAEALE